jgi:hypothetical protein
VFRLNILPPSSDLRRWYVREVHTTLQPEANIDMKTVKCTMRTLKAHLAEGITNDMLSSTLHILFTR